MKNIAERGTEIGHHALPRAPRRATAFDQRPITVTLAILLAIATTQVHASILRIATSFSRGLVFTTTAFTHTKQHVSKAHAANKQVRNLGDQTSSKMCSNNFQVAPNCGSWVTGICTSNNLESVGDRRSTRKYG